MAEDRKKPWHAGLAGLVLAFSVWSAIPMPSVDYESARKHALAFFPLVGAVLGSLFWLWHQLALRLGIGRLPLAMLSTAFVILFTGGIHLDGFMDVSDALASGRDAAGKRDILKDPHVGAFAVIRAIVLIVLNIALLAETDYHRLLFIAAGFALSRWLVVITVKRLKPAAATGMLASVRPARTSALPDLICVSLVLVGLAVLYPWETLLFSAFTALLLWRYVSMTSKQFGGISGDTCGWLIVRHETLLLLSAATLSWLT